MPMHIFKLNAVKQHSIEGNFGSGGGLARKPSNVSEFRENFRHHLSCSIFSVIFQPLFCNMQFLHAATAPIL